MTPPNHETEDEFEFKAPPYNTALWAMSLADLLSILLTFFVMLVAYSYVNKPKAQDTVKGVKGAFSQNIPTVTGEGMEKVTLGMAPLNEYYAEAETYAKDLLEIDQVSVVQDGERLIFRLPVLLLFTDDGMQIDDHKLFLTRLADGLAKHPVGRTLDVEFIAVRDARETVKPGKLPLAVRQAGTFARTMVSMGIEESRILTGLDEGNPDFFVLTFYPRDIQPAGE